MGEEKARAKKQKESEKAKMRDRLIELVKPFVSGSACEQESGVCEFTDCRTCNAQVLADHLLANGVIVPPCKVGDMVYKIFNGKIYEMRAIAIPLLISSCGAHLSVTAENNREACLSLELDDFGKTVFLTEEEAEKALAERRGE